MHLFRSSSTNSSNVDMVPSLLASLPYPGPVMEEKVTMTLVVFVVEDDSHPQCWLFVVTPSSKSQKGDANVSMRAKFPLGYA